ncbi:hypothetical protein D3C72_1524450 [compost metagenome]
MTDAEKRLWYFLQREHLDCKFRRQVPLGSYVVDFASLEKSLVIEVDGGQHAGSPQDRLRDAELRGEGFTVLRFWNNDVLKNIDGVLLHIRETLEAQG